MILLGLEKIIDLVTEYHLSGESNRHILAKAVAKAQLRALISEWDGQYCLEHRDGSYVKLKRECSGCWQDLLKECK